MLPAANFGMCRVGTGRGINGFVVVGLPELILQPARLVDGPQGSGRREGEGIWSNANDGAYFSVNGLWTG